MAKRTKADDPESIPSAGSDNSAEVPSSEVASSTGVVDSAKQAVSQAKEATTQVIDQAKGQATSRVDEQRQTVASGFQAVAQAFRNMGDDLGKGEQGPVVQYAAHIGQTLGGQVERLANYLKESDTSKLVTDVEQFARRSPAVFLGSAFVLGLAASRFLKSSRPAPDFLANMPDPNRALPPASTPLPEAGVIQPASSPASASAAVGGNSAGGL